MVERRDALRAMQQQLIGRRFDSAAVLDVDDGGAQGFLVRFRTGQRLAANVVVVPADPLSLATDHSVAEPLDSADASDWAQGVSIRLEELLDTGLVVWGVRVHLADGTVAIDPTCEPETTDDVWEVSTVPLDRPGRTERRRIRWLAWRKRTRRLVVLGDEAASEPDPSPGTFLQAAGFDIGPGRRAHADGRLISWLQLYPDGSLDDDAVGQAVVVWRDHGEELAELQHLETSTDVPDEARNVLLAAAVNHAADAGARWLDTHHDIPELEKARSTTADADGRRRYDMANLP
jgi:hypothetical protein